jgi:hypothetical protein
VDFAAVPVGMRLRKVLVSLQGADGAWQVRSLASRPGWRCVLCVRSL